MNSFLLDTHAWAWTFWIDRRFSRKALAAIEQAQSLFVSPISFFEIAQKYRLGKWPEIEPFAVRLSAILSEQGGEIATFDPDVATLAGAMRFPTCDPFDRMIAATAIHYNLPIISSDPVFDGTVTRVW